MPDPKSLRVGDRVRFVSLPEEWDDPGYVVRPCHPGANWGGVNTETCNPPTQTIEVVCGG